MNSLQTFFTRKNKFFLLLLVFLLLGGMILSLCLGTVFLRPDEVISALFSGAGSSLSQRIVWYVRLPRTLAAFLVGACLAVSGLLLQAVLANPLAAPNIIGVNAGAGLMTVLICAFVPTAAGWQPIAAFLGAVLTALAVAALGEATGASRLTLVLCGVMLTALLNAGIETVLALAPDAASGYADFRMGSLSGATLSSLQLTAPAAVLLMAAVYALAIPLEILTLGNSPAASLGLPVKGFRVLFFILSAGLAGISVSLAGVLGFVGLIAPHVSRRLTSGSMRLQITVCAMIGSVLTVLCDLLARCLFSPYELPVGILLSFVGVPFFLYLLIRQRGGHIHA